jgi:hypothetical protein
MVQAIVVGVVFGGLAVLALRRHDARAEGREARRRERLAAIVLYEEIKAAIEAIDMALHDNSSKWLVSMAESTTLTEAWREQAEALQGLGAERWYVLNDAVSAVAPSFGLISTSARAEDLKRSLVERRELLVESARILLSVRDRRTRDWSRRPARIRSLLV